MVKIFLVTLLLAGCISKNEIYQTVSTANKSIFTYANYTDSGLQLPDSFTNNKLYFKNNEFFSQKPEFDPTKGMSYHSSGDINKLHRYYEITGTLYNWLICQKAISHIKDSDQIEDIPMYSIYFLGHVKANTTYKSFLILIDKMKNDIYTEIKSVVEINYYNKKITSIRNIAGIWKEADGLTKDWTEQSGENYKYNQISDESYFPYFSENTIKEMIKHKEKIDIYIRYCFYSLDNEGRITDKYD